MMKNKFLILVIGLLVMSSLLVGCSLSEDDETLAGQASRARERSLDRTQQEETGCVDSDKSTDALYGPNAVDAGIKGITVGYLEGVYVMKQDYCAENGNWVEYVCLDDKKSMGVRSNECSTGTVCYDGACVDPSTIIPVCGNGLLEGGEECDDGNLAFSDGCSTECQILTCVDADPDNDLSVKGEISFYHAGELISVFSDNCPSNIPNQIRELDCLEGGKVETIYSCPTGTVCYDGACVE